MEEIKSFNRSNVKNLSVELQSRLDAISKELGVTLRMAGGRFSDDKVNFKLEATIEVENGSKFISDKTHYIADLAAKRDGISFSNHILNSVWEIKSGVVRVVDYKPSHKKYPYICQYANGNRIKCTKYTFIGGKELLRPDVKDFTTWLVTDPEDDRTSKNDEETYDAVEQYIEAIIADQAFFDAIDDLATLTKKTIKSVAGVIYKMIFDDPVSVNEITTYINAVYSTEK